MSGSVGELRVDAAGGLTGRNRYVGRQAAAGCVIEPLGRETGFGGRTEDDTAIRRAENTDRVRAIGRR